MLTLTIASLLMAQMPVPNPRSGRQIAFLCDFSRQTKLSKVDWVFDNGPVYNDEIEKYTSDNAAIKDGALVIEARKDGARVTSSRIESIKSWKYVYVEVTAKVPKGKGTWPAIWMLNERLRHSGRPDAVGWPKCGEIDIMENVGFDPTNFHFSLHSEKYNFMKKEQRTSVTSVTDPDAFHKFGLDWRPDKITFYLDDKPVYIVAKTERSVEAWPFNEPFYLILNLAIGGFWGGAKGVDNAIFPSQFLIKSIKIYQ